MLFMAGVASAFLCEAHAFVHKAAREIVPGGKGRSVQKLRVFQRWQGWWTKVAKIVDEGGKAHRVGWQGRVRKVARSGVLMACSVSRSGGTAPRAARSSTEFREFACIPARPGAVRQDSRDGSRVARGALSMH